MSDLQRKLEYEIRSQLDAMDKCAVGDEEKKRGTENVERLYKLLLLEREKEQKDRELDLKEKEIKAKKSTWGDKLIKGLELVLEAGAIIIPAALYDRIAQETFAFEKNEIITSSFGKNLVRVVSPKQWFKK